ncbi:MAG TPA: acyl-CoA dehydrogenase family protein, partial [Ktedonobacterales bacterium]|nr:acyl-CoA dehydrogenase family protein [Ktedonobacterales bacterium]
EVSFHPAWHELMRRAVGWGLHAAPWRDPQPGAHVARAAGFLVWSQVESGHGCPISMTYAAIPALRVEPSVAAEWEPRFTSLEYDFGLRVPQTKRGLICGMGMTEKQGGSDVRANTTRAIPDTADAVGGAGYRLTGHKWFCSAPMSDAFLVLAQAPGGLTCFLLPRVLPDGARNRTSIQRLKDKLGNRSNASSEIELREAWAMRVGDEGRGVRTIIEMVNSTRLDCIAGSAALMRQAVAQATHHAAHRAAFGRTLIDQPLMTSVLADLAIESEAATTLLLRLAAARDHAAGDPHEAALLRLGVAIGKFWVCKRAEALAAEAMECLGGAGYIEESIIPRLYRETPVNAIWEGSGNVIALDVLRALSREPESAEALLAEIALAHGASATLDDAIVRLRRELADPADAELRARRVVELMALTLQASLLARHAPAAVSDAFIAARLGEQRSLSFGALPASADTRAIVERARPMAG